MITNQVLYQLSYAGLNGAIIRQRGCSYQVETHHNGKRARQTFKTERDADNYAKQVKAEIKSEGDLALAIKGRQRIDALRLLDAFPSKKAQDDAVSAERRNVPQESGLRFDPLAVLVDDLHPSAETAEIKADEIHERDGMNGVEGGANVLS